MDLTMHIADRASAPDVLLSALSDPAFAVIEAHPQVGAFGRAYYPLVHGAAFQDLSFAVIWRGQPVLLGLCSLIDGTLGLHGLPMRMVVRDGLEPVVHRTAVKAAFSHLDGLSSVHDIEKIVLRGPGGPCLDAVSEAALAREAAASVALLATVDLGAGPSRWKQSLRKSFQQFVNWGRKSFSIRHIRGETCTDAVFDEYREFHAAVAGRVTRSKDSWDAMQHHVASGRGELILADLDGRLAAGSLFIDGTQTCIYMTGVYDRTLDKPLAHYMVWHGMERAAERGMRWLELGDLHQVDAVDEKAYNIGYFKRGFATDIEQWVDWRWSPKPRDA